METGSIHSLTPDQIPLKLSPTVITAVGANGQDGSVVPALDEVDAYAFRGSDGKNGINATPPTDGRRGQNIEIELRYNPDSTGGVEVIRDNHIGIEIENHECLLLDAHGGDGGNGGHGGPGQHGGEGVVGAQGEDGGPGGRGGNGGYGTDGANGGEGGNVLTIVHEAELDLLLAVDLNPNLKGGKGGKVGTHGAPGVGGGGGPGGPSYKTYNYSGDSTTHRGGRKGPPGFPGSEPPTILNSGLDGRDGRMSIHVISDEDVIRSYSNRYQLIAESFEAFDENDDGIVEPGEYLIVQNITVRNDGPMVSPSGQNLKLVIRESPWLKPDTASPLFFPDAIPPNGRALVTGKLRAFIRHETIPRSSGEPLNAHENVSLLGYSERLHRFIPEFSGSVPIMVQYPLQLPRPVYMDCMEKCDQMSISWMVNNVSTEGYGANGRKMRTRLTDTGPSFVLPSANEGPHSVIDNIDQIEPSDGNQFGETFTVIEETRSFTTGNFVVELFLSDPHTDELRLIMFYSLNIQISEGYKLNNTSRFLFLVNANTDNTAITRMQKFVRTELFVDADTFNLSLTGTLIDETTHRNTLLGYQGKSIIISGNSFSHFGKFTRYNWDLIDPRVVQILLMNRTSFLFCGVVSENGQKSLARWMALVRYPVGLGVGTAGSLTEHKDRSTLLASIRSQTATEIISSIDDKHQYVVEGTPKMVEEMGTSLAKKLDKQSPMRRFLVTPEEDNLGALSAIEGLPRSSSCIMSCGPIINSMHSLAPHQEVMMIDAIPFHVLVVMFWNIVGSLKGNGIAPATLYRGLTGVQVRLEFTEKYNESEDEGAYGGSKMISQKVCNAIAWAIEHALHSDIQQLCHVSPTIDKIRTASILTHVPRLQDFLQAIPKDSTMASREGVAFAVRVLGSLNASLTASNFLIDIFASIPGLSSRRIKTRRNVQRYQRSALSFMAPKDLSQEIRTEIKRETERLTRALKVSKESPMTTDSIVRRSLAALTGEATAMRLVINLAAGDGSLFFDAETFARNRKAYLGLVEQQAGDVQNAREVREEVLERLYDTIDFLPIASFE